MIVVVGSGVVGLSSAATLLEAGHEVEIWARELPPRTTSNVAAAFWLPYRVSPHDEVTRWGRVSYRRFVELATRPETGITLRPVFDYARHPLARPWWADAVPSLRPATADELPPEFSFAWVFDAPVIDTRRYMPWLLERVRDLGGRIERREVHTLAEPLAVADAVVNCSGLGARQLAHDPLVVPIRGQLLVVKDPGIAQVSLDEHAPGHIAYVVPRGDDVVLGGTAQDHDEDLRARPDEAEAIRRSCAVLHPELADAPALADVVGLRPGRSTVRLQAELVDGKRLVHNYGHGGAGVTLSWGCAEAVAELLR